MKIDLHIHSKEGSDGRWPLEAIFAEARQRGIDLIAITDHDSIDAQEQARALAQSSGIQTSTRGKPSPSMCSGISSISITLPLLRN